MYRASIKLSLETNLYLCKNVYNSWVVSFELFPYMRHVVTGSVVFSSHSLVARLVFFPDSGSMTYYWHVTIAQSLTSMNIADITVHWQFLFAVNSSYLRKHHYVGCHGCQTLLRAHVQSHIMYQIEYKLTHHAYLYVATKLSPYVSSANTW